NSPSARMLLAAHIFRTVLAPIQQFQIDPPLKTSAEKLQFPLPVLLGIHMPAEDHGQHLPVLIYGRWDDPMLGEPPKGEETPLPAVLLRRTPGGEIAGEHRPGIGRH